MAHSGRKKFRAKGARAIHNHHASNSSVERMASGGAGGHRSPCKSAAIEYARRILSPQRSWADGHDSEGFAGLWGRRCSADAISAFLMKPPRGVDGDDVGYSGRRPSWCGHMYVASSVGRPAGHPAGHPTVSADEPTTATTKKGEQVFVLPPLPLRSPTGSNSDESDHQGDGAISSSSSI